MVEGLIGNEEQLGATRKWGWSEGSGQGERNKRQKKTEENMTLAFWGCIVNFKWHHQFYCYSENVFSFTVHNKPLLQLCSAYITSPDHAVVVSHPQKVGYILSLSPSLRRLTHSLWFPSFVFQDLFNDCYVTVVWLFFYSAHISFFSSPPYSIVSPPWPRK